MTDFATIDFESANGWRSSMVKHIFLDFDSVLNTDEYQAQLAIEG